MASPGFIVFLFAHTDSGSHALKELLEAGIDHRSIHVIGDLGLPAGQPGAEHHVTFDLLHVPSSERPLFMDTIRAGGVVLAADRAALEPSTSDHIASRHKALKVLETAPSDPNLSHNR